MDEPVPCRGHRIERSRQHKHKGAVGYAGKAAALQGAGADALEGEHTEQFPESFDCFVQQRCHRFGGAIAAGQTGTATGDHHIHRGSGDPAAQVTADLIAISGADFALVKPTTIGFTSEDSAPMIAIKSAVN